MKITVTGAGGFVGYHLTNYLKEAGHWVRGVDIKPPEFAPSQADEFLRLDLRLPSSAIIATRDVDWVFALAADMGGMGFIGNPANEWDIIHNNTRINLNTIEAARRAKVQRYLFSSSACVYPVYRQDVTDVTPLREEEAFPAQPQEAYGWEKLYTELLCHYSGVPARIVRFHNVYGPFGAWRGGREKAPAALCRKVAEAKRDGKHQIEIWGDGQQTRSFMYVDDCVRGIMAVMESEYTGPLNIGSDRAVTIDELADIIAAIAGWPVDKVHIAGPQGVRGRNADLARVLQTVGWQPHVSLEDGLARTYQWIEKQVMA
jgi:GDP-D-mannose 3', 5'-epimerase